MPTNKDGRNNQKNDIKTKKMSELSTNTVLHKRITNFVDWIKPDASKREGIKERSKNVRKNIKNKAEEKDLVIRSTPYGGSFSARCGLKRHFRGDAEVEGLDVDLCFVVDDKDNDTINLDYLLDEFYTIVDECYPKTTKKKTKSSIKLMFDDHVNFDIVPLLIGESDDEQILIRSNGDRIKTVVKKHTEFVKSRTKSSSTEEGRVHFNECLRLMKWWRDSQASNSYTLGGDKAPSSFLMNMLAAHAYDKLSVKKTYAETLAQWFGYLAHNVRNKESILFADYANPVADEYTWSVIDPVNPENNIVSNWSEMKREELADWFEKSRDDWSRAISSDLNGKDKKSLDQLVSIFGNSFKNHCDNN
jgi:hypothetical protein